MTNYNLATLNILHPGEMLLNVACVIVLCLAFCIFSLAWIRIRERTSVCLFATMYGNLLEIFLRVTGNQGVLVKLTKKGIGQNQCEAPSKDNCYNYRLDSSY